MISFATSFFVGTQVVVANGCIALTITLNYELVWLPMSPSLVGLPSLYSSMLSSNSIASLMQAAKILCFIGYKAVFSFLFSNPSKKLDTSCSWFEISFLGHLKMYFFSHFG